MEANPRDGVEVSSRKGMNEAAMLLPPVLLDRVSVVGLRRATSKAVLFAALLRGKNSGSGPRKAICWLLTVLPSVLLSSKGALTVLAEEPSTTVLGSVALLPDTERWAG